jgi:Zn-dependent peptidase ImmA (M78 family)/DNA-binding XRE family transcriptional regulator
MMDVPESNLPHLAQMPTDELTLARRLRKARIGAGLSQSDVARESGLPRPAISLIESGRRSVSSVELAEFVRLYRTSFDSLLSEHFPVEGKLRDGMLAYFRATAPLSSHAEHWLAREIDECERYADLERRVFGHQRFELPTYRVTEGLAYEQGERLAWQERRRLGLGNSPVRSMIDLLESEGVKVRITPFAVPGVSGCYLYSEEIGPCVLINKKEQASRQRFTAAHEYAHFLVDRAEAEAELCTYAKSSAHYEVRANTFAAAFLLPAVGVEEALHDRGKRVGDAIDAADAIDLAFRFGASYEAVLWRLRNLGWIPPREREALAKLPVRRLWASLGYRGEPGDSEGTPDRFNSLAIEAWRLGRLPQAQLAKIVGLAPQQMRRAFGAPTPRRRPKHPAEDPDWY